MWYDTLHKECKQTENIVETWEIIIMVRLIIMLGEVEHESSFE